MRLLLALVIASCCLGCSGGDSAEGERNIPGPKPEISDIPPGKEVPGDSRPSGSSEGG
ncbi:MAG TPA: hypothetical protein PKA27_02820 [Fimbriimonadaceae bacterium]|nr:hypothetical protein [Fimbriimonadaceae bacterium]